MNFKVSKHMLVFTIVLIVALCAYACITSPLLQAIKVVGCALSALLFMIAMQARIGKSINTKNLGADWALLFVGACGLSFFVFFWDLKSGIVSTKAWWALITGILCHVVGLACWYGQNYVNMTRKKRGER